MLRILQAVLCVVEDFRKDDVQLLMFLGCVRLCAVVDGFRCAGSCETPGKVLVLPLDGDFLSLFYRLDYFAAHNMSAPRTLEEYVAASIYFNGKDLDGDGELDYGSCFPHHGWASHYYFWAWVAPFTQYLGTAQGVFFDVDTLEPLVDNPAVQEAVRLWKQVAGPPEWGDGSTNGQPRGTNSTMDLWLQGQCAMTLEWEQAYIAFDTADNISVGSAVHPGSERVWSRDGNGGDGGERCFSTLAHFKQQVRIPRNTCVVFGVVV